ncbi:MAG: DUF2147 domain-containing protein [Pseudomonadota bacterium]
MSLLVVLSLLATGTMSAAARADQEAVFGIWATKGTMIEVGPAEDGGLSARIIALKNPNWREKDGVGVIGEPKIDLHNPDESLRERPLLGLEMLSDYRFERGKWRGRLYLPSNGTSWTSSAEVKNGELRIRGFIGMPMLGKTQKFAPLAECNENILRMIATANMAETPCDELMEDVQ